MTSLPCPYCGVRLALLRLGPFIERHYCPLTAHAQSEVIRPIEEGGTWFLGMADQVHLHAELRQGSRQVRITTGRLEDDGSAEVLIRAVGASDLEVALFDDAVSREGQPAAFESFDGVVSRVG